jgi:hypothetical protein
MENIAQLEPEGSRRGTEVARGSDIVIAAAIPGPITYNSYGREKWGIVE